MDASERLIKAAKSGNIKEVKKLLTRGALFTKDEFGNTALHEAAWSGNNDITKILLKASSFVDSVNGAGFTPLHLASQNGHAKVAKTLLKWRANATLKNQHDEAPIHLIAKYDHAHLIPVFAAAKVDLDLKARDDNTALHIAAKLGNTPTVKALIQNGANPNITNQKNKLPIDYAEISRCQDAVKLLTPFTEQLLISKDSKTRKSFFKGRSSKSSKTKNSLEGPVMPCNDSAVQYRQRSHSVATCSAHSKRYSREFEDISSYLSNGTVTSGSSTDSRRSQRSKTRSPSLEELLEDVEKEAQGPSYRYPLPSSSDSDTSSVGYHSVNRMSSGSLSSPTSNNSYNFGKVPKLSPNHGGSTHAPSPLLKSPHQSGDFILKPKAMKTVSLHSETENKDEDYVCLRPSSEITRKALPREKLNSVPLISDEVLNHTYEYLPPLPPKEKSEKPSDAFDSYIEMAPRTDVRPLSTPSNMPKSPLKFSPVHKVAVIGDETKNYKRLSLTETESTPKSILKQPDDGGKRNSEIDKYLQDELDTIRHAFQIRLSQMERKYQKQLASVSSLQGMDSPKQPKDTSSPARLPHNHRASWHGNTRHGEGPPAAMLGEGFNSGSEESLSSSVADSTCSSSVFNTTTDSELNDSKTSNNPAAPAAALTGEMQTLIQEQVQQYKSQMMETWMKEAEEKMAAMEQSYLKKISGQQKLFHLQSSGGLDRSETFV